MAERKLAIVPKPRQKPKEAMFPEEGKRAQALRIAAELNGLGMANAAGKATQASWTHWEKGERQIPRDPAMKLEKKFPGAMGWLYYEHMDGFKPEFRRKILKAMESLKPPR